MESAMPHTGARFLSRSEIDYFLSRPLIARLATVQDEQPHVAPMWFLWDSTSLFLETSSNFQKARDLVRNPKCAVIIDESLGGLRFWGIFMQGRAELIRGPEETVLTIVSDIYRKYLGEEGLNAPTPQRMIGSGQHLIIKLTPTKIVTWDDTHSAIALIE